MKHEGDSARLITQTTSPGEAVGILLSGKELYVSLPVTPEHGASYIERQLHHAGWRRRRRGQDVWLMVKAMSDAVGKQWVVASLRARL